MSPMLAFWMDAPVRKRLMLLGGGALFVAVAGGWWDGGAGTSIPSENGPEEWQLPAAIFAADSTGFAEVKLASMLGIRESQGDVASEAPALRWRLVAIVREGSVPLAVFDVQGQGLVRLKAGDTLTDGSRVDEIQSDRVSILVKGLSQSIRLFASGERS